jgi:FkbM family methyltransferase
MANFDLLRNVKRYAKNHIAKIQNTILNRTPIVVSGAYNINYSCYRRSALDRHIINNGILPEYLCTTSDLVLPNDSVIFDIGANVGFVSFVLAKKYAPLGSVYAFEPDEKNIKQFKENLAINSFGNVYLHECALQDNENLDVLAFNIRRLIDADSNENRGISTITNIELGKVGTSMVSASTIDKKIDQLKLKRLDLIKIDVEGAEFMVIKGGINSIKKYHPIIQYEYSSVLDGLSNSSNALDAFNLIKSLGYKQFIVKDEAHLVPIDSISHHMSDTNILCFYN